MQAMMPLNGPEEAVDGDMLMGATLGFAEASIPLRRHDRRVNALFGVIESLRAENVQLRRRNRRLRADIAEMGSDLVEAHANIGSLECSLDATEGAYGTVLCQRDAVTEAFGNLAWFALENLAAPRRPWWRFWN